LIFVVPHVAKLAGGRAVRKAMPMKVSLMGLGDQVRDPVMGTQLS